MEHHMIMYLTLMGHRSAVPLLLLGMGVSFFNKESLASAHMSLFIQHASVDLAAASNSIYLAKSLARAGGSPSMLRLGFPSPLIPITVFDKEECGSVFVSLQLPHMLPYEDGFSTAATQLGLHNKDAIVVYDGKGIFSAARAWW